PALYRVFFSAHRDPLYLHSFPTRRSSDLLVMSGQTSGPAGLKARHYTGKPGLSRLYLSDGRWEIHRAIHGHCRVVPVPPGPRHKDRKSTRLNSSHVKISYAVFCLKKKTTS